MSGLEQKIRTLINDIRYPVDPAHEAAFRLMLMQQRRRRRLVVLFIAIAGLSGSLLLFLPMLTTGESVTTPFDAVPPTESGAQKSTISPASQDDNVIAGVGTPERDDEVFYPGTSVPEPFRHREEQVTVSAPIFQSPSATVAHIEYLEIRSVTQEVADIIPVAHLPLPGMLLSSAPRFTPGALQAVPANTYGLITPVRQRAGRPKFGVEVLWAATGVTNTAAHVQSGHAYQAGGYFHLPLYSKWYLRLDGGFLMIDGGFEFVKHSVSTHYSFGVRSQTNTLEAQKLYNGYAGFEGGLRWQRHTFGAGVQAQYLYGARGSIERLEIDDETTIPIVTSIGNGWVATTGLSKFSMHGTAHWRYNMRRRVEIGAHIAIPLTSLISKNVPEDAFGFRTAHYGIRPGISLSYQISQ